MKIHKKLIVISLFASLIFGCVFWIAIYNLFPNNHGDIFMWSRRCMIISAGIIYIASLISKLDPPERYNDPEFFYSYGVIAFILFDVAAIFITGIPVLFVIQ